MDVHRIQKAELEKRNEQFLRQLLEKIEKFKKLEQLLLPIFDEFAPVWHLSGKSWRQIGQGWDLSQGFFQRSGFEVLSQYAELLQQDESIMELAELLGRHRREEITFEKEMRDKVVVKTVFHPRRAYKGQICGVETGNDISSVLPSELALYKSPATKKLFTLKFAQKQLLQYKYENLAPEKISEREQEEVEKQRREEKKGPILMCVDTSGSMRGAPERIAKTIAFALTKLALKEKRKCFLISFSTGIETLDLTDFEAANGIELLMKFLQMSFNGGTDATPALAFALEKLATQDWQDADVLMVSDFKMSALPRELVSKIKAEQEKQTKFHSLVIGNYGSEDVTAAFDNNWVYNPSDSDAQRKLVRQIKSLE